MAGYVLLVALVLGTVGVVGSLRCYHCNSHQDPLCGSTWGLSDEEGRKYLVNCPGTHNACDKIISDWQGDGSQYTYRTCWNQTIDYFRPDGCGDEDVRGGHYCHCTTDACNGRERISAASFPVMMAVAGCFLHRFMGTYMQ